MISQNPALLRNVDPKNHVSKEWRMENAVAKFRPIKLVNRDIPPNSTLRRFIDLPKLFDLLSTSTMHLTKLGLLMNGDPFECNSRKTYDAWPLEKLRKSIDDLACFLPLGAGSGGDFLAQKMHLDERIAKIKTLPLEALKQAVWYLEYQHLKEFMTCGCWYMGDSDSDAMWKIYSKDIGVSIKSSVSRLTGAIKTCYMPAIWNPKLELATVKYDDSPSCKNDEPWLQKRSAFHHEKEARLFCEAPDSYGPVGLELQVDLGVLIEEITITPLATKWQSMAIASSIQAMLRRGKNNRVQPIKVAQSEHLKALSPQWPKAPGPFTSIASALFPEL